MPDERPQPAATRPRAPIEWVFPAPSGRANMTSHRCPQIAELIAPQRRFTPTDDPEPLGLKLLKVKSVCVHWENGNGAYHAR
jgi:hypothetical protein